MDWITTSTILTDLSDFTNQSAWQHFVERFRAPIVRFAQRLGLAEPDAEEVAQETLAAFASAYRQKQYDRSKGRLSHWLFGIAHRQALSARRSNARRHALTFQPDGDSYLESVPDGQAADRLWEEEWEQAVLELCLHRVRQEVEPMTMRAFEAVMGERTPAEAAREMGIPVKAVYNAKYTVLKRLRELRTELEALE